MNQLTFVLLVCLVSIQSFANNNQITVDVEQVIDDFHLAAAQADFDRYFAHMDEQGVFLGTDATERWTKKQFKFFVKPYFSEGKGWTYQSKTRQISLLPQSNVVFFDELLVNNFYGECRGSGLLINKNGKWLILQYNLSIPVPNNLSKTITTLIKQQAEKPSQK